MPANQATTDTNEFIASSTSGFGLSYAITSILSALLVVLKERSEAVHNGLTAITGNHWVTHGVLNLIVFLVLGFVFYRIGGGIRMTANALIATIFGATVISGLIIAGYFI